MSERVLVTVVPAAVVAAVAWASGGYFPRTWGALLLVEALVLVAFAILATRVEIARPPVVLAGALVALVLWEVASRAWAAAPDGAILEAERTLVYAAGAAVAALVVTRRRTGELVLGVFAGAAVVTVGGLAQHVLGSGVPNGRLELPVGYANAAGMLAGTTLLLGLGLAVDSPRWRRAVCAACLPPAAATLYLTLSRGSMIAVGLGLVVLAVTTHSRRQVGRMAAAATPAVLAVAVAAGGQFAAEGIAASEVVSLVGIFGLTAFGAALAARPTADERVPHGHRRVPVRLALGACAVALAGLAVVGLHEIRAVRSTPAAQQGAPDRLLSTSTSDRASYWKVAASMVEDEPLLGAGAGGFERTWLRDRPALIYVRDAHNLYLETLAELGPVGLGLMLTALLAPFLAARSAVGEPTSRAALAAYIALLAHAGLDWDWELPVVALCLVPLGVATAATGGSVSHELTRRTRSALLAGATVLGAIALVVHTGNGATAEAHEALDRGDAGEARADATRARRFMPWAAEPWQLLGEAELAAGRLGRAREHIRRATREDSGSWSAWLALATASAGPERRLALERARALNPLAPEIDLVAGGDP